MFWGTAKGEAAAGVPKAGVGAAVVVAGVPKPCVEPNVFDPLNEKGEVWLAGVPNEGGFAFNEKLKELDWPGVAWDGLVDAFPPNWNAVVVVVAAVVVGNTNPDD